MSNFWLQTACASGALSVVFGAFGAHGLKNKVEPQMLEVWNTAAHYQLIHSVVLLAAPLVAPRLPVWSCRLFLGGITLFSGSLYTMVLTGNRKLGAITPIGGTALIAGWVALALKL